MNLEDVIDPEYGLQQDDYSLSGVVFGEEGQLSIVGWSGKCRSNKYYVLKCSNCSQDSELFGAGYFRSSKSHLVKGKVPCGCSRSPQWSKEQHIVLCSRKALELGYTFIDFVGKWKGVYTKIKMSCNKHGEWDSGIVNNLIHHGHGCPVCKYEAAAIKAAAIKAAAEANTKSDHVMINSFHVSDSFHPDTKFWRSERKNSRGHKAYWYMFCPECGETGESLSSNLQAGKRPCACSPMRQQECYINWIIDNNNMAVAIKFGIARDSKQRIKSQDRQSAYTLKQHSIYVFPSVEQCKKAERECKKELECGVVLKRDMSDGYSETTWAYNIGRVKAIYERNGGIIKEG